MRSGNLEYFIDKAMTIHGKKYGYKNVIENEPNSVKDKIIVTCPIHGDFETTFDSHVNKKCGCPLCNRGKRRTTESFIEECKEIHKDKNYDYSKTVFNGVAKKVTVICHEKNVLGEEHGEFQMRAGHFLNGHGCPYCAKRYLSTAEVIYNARQIHGDKYDYSLVEYHNNNSEKLPIICHEKDEDGVEHGIFTPVWYSHISGVGCPKCNGGVKHTKDNFVKDAVKMHGSRYDYNNFVYVNANTPGKITCHIHGDFMQTPYAHTKMGQGCPKCKSSKMENLLINAFDKHGIEYDYQVNISELGNQTIDFKIPSKNLYIECQGEQHYIPTTFGSMTMDEAKDAYKKRMKLDKEKYDVITRNGSNVIYFSNPIFFHVEDVDIHKGFYSDKIVLETVDEVLKCIDSSITVDNNTLLDRFRSDLKSLSNGVISYGYRFKYKNYIIYFNDLKGNNREHINDVRRHNIKKGYKVIHIFEDEYVNNREIVLSKLRHIFNLENDKPIKIQGRKCKVEKITNDEAAEFLSHNHIQGFVSSSIYLGAKYNGELIAVMTFLEESNGYWNLTRFASKNGAVCQGVGGKLFKYFTRNYNPIEVKSFADRRWTTDKENNLYTKLGFKLDSVLASEYRYFKEGVSKEREHKFGFRKQTLHKKYKLPLSMTEKEMTEALGYVRIWDCGLFKYVWKNENNNTVISDEVNVDKIKDII